MTSLVPSLLRSFVDVDGEALVMHAGERPYVIGPAGQVELAKRPLSMDAVKGIVSQLLPADVSHALDEFGAVQHEIVSPPGFAGERFTVVAARGADDMWVEVRRRKVGVADGVPEVSFEPSAQRLAIAATVRRGAEAGNLRRSAATPKPSTAGATTKPASDTVPESMSAILSAMVSPMSAPPSTPPNLLGTPQAEPREPIAVPPAVVVPMSRSSARSENASAVAGERLPTLDHLLRSAAARGASTLYLFSNAPPSVRVDGDVLTLDDEPSLGAHDVESLLSTVISDRDNEDLRSGVASEWIRDLEGVGRVRCVAFRDQRGPGGVFRIVPVRAVSTEQLGLSREVECLALEPGGLVLVTGPRLSGKRTTISALVDFMNRARRDHVITIERECNVIHGPGTSIISQREAHGGPDDLEGVARAALREDPDVLVIESLQTAALVDIALDAAASGQLVIGGLPAHDTASAIDHIISLYPAEKRRQVRFALAENLRGVVAQVLVRKIGGGRVAAREVLLSTPAVTSAIADGRTSQLPMVIDAGRSRGMRRLNDALATLVQSGAVDIREAYRQAADRKGLLADLQRLGIDTASLEAPS
jgi:twitching motility protein PilT